MEESKAIQKIICDEMHDDCIEWCDLGDGCYCYSVRQFAQKLADAGGDFCSCAERRTEVAPVVHGRWERCGGDLHSSGYAVSCSACNKTHFVHYESSLGGLFGCKELFKEPKYCPNCGAKMDGA